MRTAKLTETQMFINFLDAVIVNIGDKFDVASAKKIKEVVKSVRADDYTNKNVIPLMIKNIRRINSYSYLAGEYYEFAGLRDSEVSSYLLDLCCDLELAIYGVDKKFHECVAA